MESGGDTAQGSDLCEQATGQQQQPHQLSWRRPDALPLTLPALHPVAQTRPPPRPIQELCSPPSLQVGLRSSPSGHITPHATHSSPNTLTRGLQVISSNLTQKTPISQLQQLSCLTSVGTLALSPTRHEHHLCGPHKLPYVCTQDTEPASGTEGFEPQRNLSACLPGTSRATPPCHPWGPSLRCLVPRCHAAQDLLRDPRATAPKHSLPTFQTLP